MSSIRIAYGVSYGFRTIGSAWKRSGLPFWKGDKYVNYAAESSANRT